MSFTYKCVLCVVCDLVCIYVCTFRIFQNYLELKNPFGVVENNMSKHGSWTLLDCPSEFQGKAEPKSRSRPLCHYVSSFPKWKMTVITVGIIQLKLKDVNIFKEWYLEFGFTYHISVLLERNSICRTQISRDGHLNTFESQVILMPIQWYWRYI